MKMETANHVAFRTCVDLTLNTKKMTCVALTQNPEISTQKVSTNAYIF